MIGQDQQMPDKRELIERLVASHGKHLRRFLRTRVRNAADVPDIIQEVFLRLLRVPNHENIRTPEAYLFTIAHHVAQQHALRSSRAMPAVGLEDVLTEVGAVSEIDPALELSAQQCIEQLDRALAQLSPKVQATFLLCRRDGLSIEAISERLNISRPMAKKYLVRALTRIRKQLKESE